LGFCSFGEFSEIRLRRLVEGELRVSDWGPVRNTAPALVRRPNIFYAVVSKSFLFSERARRARALVRGEPQRDPQPDNKRLEGNSPDGSFDYVSECVCVCLGG
jgi:hypothetical protein